MKATPTKNTGISRNINQFSSLAEALDCAALGQTGYNFYSGRGKLDAVLSYARLRAEARKLAQKLTGTGVPRGARVALVADTHPDFVRFFFACQYAGLTPVPVPAQIQLGGRTAYIEQLERLLSICQAKLAMATDDFLPFLTEASQDLDIRFTGNPDSYDALPESDARLIPLASSELAYLQYTSGSTRFPRGVMITQKTVLNNLVAIVTHGIQIRPGDRAVSWLPYFHDMGLVGLLLAPMIAQISVDYLNTRDFAMRPRLWLKLMSENQATVSFSPPFGYELAARRLRDDETDQYDLSAWRVAGVGAEMISTESLKYFAEKLAGSGFNERAFLPCYGMAECSLAVCFGSLDSDLRPDQIDAERLATHQEAVPVNTATGSYKGKSRTFINCGEPLPGFELEIRDEKGCLLPERKCGTLFLRGPSVMSGYFNDLKTTREVLSPNGWLDTGDIAYKIGDSIFITGRKKDMIIINGRNIWPQDIEHIAELQTEIRTRDASAFSFSGPDEKEQAVVMCQCRESDPLKRTALKERLHRLIGEELGIDCIVELVPRNTLSRTTSGKPCRYGARKAYLVQQEAALSSEPINQASNATH